MLLKLNEPQNKLKIDLENLINYIKNFNKDAFQGSISYHKIEKDVMLHNLFSCISVYLFLKDKESNKHIDLNKYFLDFNETFNNVELTEQSIVNLYLNINERKKYIRNVQLMCFIVYKQNWNIFNFDKFKKQKYYFRKIWKYDIKIK